MSTKNATNRPTTRFDAQRGKFTGKEEIELEHTAVKLESTRVGVIARIEPTERREEVEYAGPLPRKTIAALREVADAR